MIPHELIRQIRRLQVRARRAVEDLVGGEYHSVFKGMGIAFEEVREYQPGDDIRTIDWNVTARMGHPFIKRFVEERELTVMILMDCSASQAFGSGSQQKREVAAEVAAVLAFSAVSNNDRVGLLTFTDRIERFVPPAKGARHALRLVRDILFLKAEGKGTALTPALHYLNRVMRRRCIVFVLSDFLDSGFERSWGQTARKHDLIAIRITDALEDTIPSVGLIELEDPETGERHTLDTASPSVRAAYARVRAQTRDALSAACRTTGADLLEVGTDGRHLDALARFFSRRARRSGKP